MLWTAVGVVRGVYEKNCSMSCGTAGHQTLAAARQSPGDQADSAALAASQKRVDSLKIGCGYEASPCGRRIRQPGHHDCPEDRLQADVVHTMVTQDTQSVQRLRTVAEDRRMCRG